MSDKYETKAHYINCILIRILLKLLYFYFHLLPFVFEHLNTTISLDNGKFFCGKNEVNTDNNYHNLRNKMF